MNRIKAFWAGIAVVAAVFLSVPAEAAVADRIVAVVNDEVITLSDLNNAFEPYQARFEATYQGTDREKARAETRLLLLNRMIDGMLMEQESKKTGIAVQNDEVDDAIANIRKERNLSPEDLRRGLERDGITQEAFRKDIRNQLMRMKLIRRDIKSRVAVTDEEIGEYYRKHREDYEGKESVRLRQILLLLPKDANPEGKARIQAEAEALHRRLLNGELFERLSAEHSQGPEAGSGGDIGYIEKGMIHSEVEDEAFSLPVNKISGVIESPVGFHIIQVTDRRGAGGKAIESVREEIRKKIDQEKMEKRFQGWMAELRKKSHIEIKL